MNFAKAEHPRVVAMERSEMSWGLAGTALEQQPQQTAGNRITQNGVSTVAVIFKGTEAEVSSVAKCCEVQRIAVNFSRPTGHDEAALNVLARQANMS